MLRKGERILKTDSAQHHGAKPTKGGNRRRGSAEGKSGNTGFYSVIEGGNKYKNRLLCCRHAPLTSERRQKNKAPHHSSFSHQKRCLQVGAHVPPSSRRGRFRWNIHGPAAVPLDVPHDPEGRGLKYRPNVSDAVENYVVVVVAMVFRISTVAAAATAAAAVLTFDRCERDGGDLPCRALPGRPRTRRV